MALVYEAPSSTEGQIDHARKIAGMNPGGDMHRLGYYVRLLPDAGQPGPGRSVGPQSPFPWSVRAYSSRTSFSRFTWFCGISIITKYPWLWKRVKPSKALSRTDLPPPLDVVRLFPHPGSVMLVRILANSVD